MTPSIYPAADPPSPATAVPRPPVPPALYRWPKAVQSAALLRGTAVRCGPGIRLASWPDSPSVRATAIGAFGAEDRVATHLTAAWIWRAAPEPGEPLEFSVSRGRGHWRDPRQDLLLHEYRLGPTDIVHLGSFAATHPVRTLYDLLRATRFDAPQRFACRMLLTHFVGGRAHFLETLPERRRPHHGRILNRLAEL